MYHNRVPGHTSLWKAMYLMLFSDITTVNKGRLSSHRQQGAEYTRFKVYSGRVSVSYSGVAKPLLHSDLILQCWTAQVR